jgi:predicted O-linked N-acetylglucosamine transferase (SPINDLY family)
MATNYIDYLIADHTLIPNEKRKYYSEKIVFMPNSYQPNDAKTIVLKKSFTRKDFGLPNDKFVFCCMNQHYKINPNTFAGWMNILSKVKESVLWLPYGNITSVNNLKKEAKKFGISEDRLIFASHLPLREDHLSRIKLADLFLDTLPLNAHATANDALKMGLPVLTCTGSSFVSRVAASLLRAVNLPEMITSTQEEYEALAIQLATHPKKLKIIKDKLNTNLSTAPLYNASLYTQNLEAAYQIMYKRYQNGLAPDDISINIENN